MCETMQIVVHNKLASKEDLKYFQTSLCSNEKDAKGLLNIKQEAFKELNLLVCDIVMGQLPEDEVVAVKASDNGDCLYNAMSIAICGDKSPAFLLRLLVAGELSFNAKHYAEYPVFCKTSCDTDISVETLLSIALKHPAEKKSSETQDKCKAVKVQALSACAVGEWSSFLNLLALASVISRPLCILRFCPVLYIFKNPYLTTRSSSFELYLTSTAVRLLSSF